jgi:hypothetical protein
MLTEKDLLLDIMSKLPDNSKWHISKNSWDKIPLIFKDFDFNSEHEDWILNIEKDKLASLLIIIENEELYDKIIRQFITNIQGETIMDSYDVMLFTKLYDSFPSKSELLSKYKDSEVCVE